MNVWKKSLALCLTLMMLASLAACGGDQEPDETPAEEPVTLRVAALKGPTAMGMVKLMDDSKPVTEAVKELEKEHEDVVTSGNLIRLYAGGLGG